MGEYISTYLPTFAPEPLHCAYHSEYQPSDFMAQHNNIAETVREYTRTDYAALRYRLTRIDAAAIMRLYTEEDLASRGIQSQSELMKWLDELRDHLVERARLVNPKVSSTLDDARSRNIWTKGVMDFIISAGEQNHAKPKLQDGISVWFRPVVFRTLAAEGLHTLQQLKTWIEARGSGWYRPIPKLGQGKAQAFERWFAAHHLTLGKLNRLPDTVSAAQLELSPLKSQAPIPLERVGAISRTFDGSQGLNRNSSFCLISARNDLEAVHAYLYKFRGRDKTLRSYQKELERLLLWCVLVRRIPLSSMLTDDCEAYKTFISAPSEDWTGTKTRRNSPHWRPFEGPLSAESQRYAVQVIRTFFEWLLRVRYLGGNPWVTVSDPLVAEKELAMDIDKALPRKLWESLAMADGILDRACARYSTGAGQPAKGYQAKSAETPGAQYRLARAIIFLLGHTGIRREEASFATREHLKPIAEQADKGNGLWELAILGKRKKWRTVFVPPRVVSALRTHWADRGHDFDVATSRQYLVSPVVVPNTPHAQEKHLEGLAKLSGNGFAPDALYRVVKNTLLRLADDDEVHLSPDERNLLRRAAPHALRHTFATYAVSKDMPTDVLQRWLGHTSPQTTAIYVRAERARGIEEAEKFFG